MYLSDSSYGTKPALAMSPTQLGSMVDHYAGQLRELISQRAYQLFEARGHRHGHDLDDWLRAEQEQTPIEIAETNSELIVSVLVHGIEEKELEVFVDCSQVLVTRKQWRLLMKNQTIDRTPGNISDSELSSELVRAIRLPCAIIPEQATVKLHHDGFIKVTLPKPGNQQ